METTTPDTDTCHCGGSLRWSDHCPCCGCEEHETTCDHRCDGLTDGSSCNQDHQEEGR